jgi:o-succinylbenzoate synthase
MKLTYRSERLQFLKPAATSKGAYLTRELYLLELQLSDGRCYQAECAPLPHLSYDDMAGLPAAIEGWCRQPEKLLQAAPDLSEEQARFPALAFALESLHRQWISGVPGLLWNNAFTRGEQSIPINGLVWMEDAEAMLAAAMEKAATGFRCIKFKVGALDFDAECRLLEAIRKKYPPEQLELRVDANGAFTPGDAAEKMRSLSRYHLHSIEQPVQATETDALHRLCRESNLPVALDESLIGLDPFGAGAALIRSIAPAYLVLKPTLLGGFQRSAAWAQLAQETLRGWWATSALESNIGLSAIAQWCGNYPVTQYQGLGTGRLFQTNFPSRLRLVGEEMWFGPVVTG